MIIRPDPLRPLDAGALASLADSTPGAPAPASPSRPAPSSGPGRASVLAGLAAAAPPPPPPEPPVDGARVAADVKALDEAMSGLGTDEEAIYDVLEERPPAEVRAAEKAFDERYRADWGSLRLALHDEMSGKELERALAALDRAHAAAPGPVAITPSALADADRLHAALDGMGTDEATIKEILTTRTPAEVRAIEEAFAKEFGTEWGTLRIALHDDLSGDDLSQGLAALDRAAPAIGTPEFDRLLDAETNTTGSASSSATMLYDGTSSFQQRYELIAGAKTSIHLQTFIFNDDETGKKTAQALIDAAKRGVDVRVMYDPLGSHVTDERLFDEMRAAGVKVLAPNDPYAKPWTLNARWHEKLLLVDGQAGITGGMNVGDEYAYGGSSVASVRSRDGGMDVPWRDTDILVRGSAVDQMEAAFLKSWETLGGKREPLPPKAAPLAASAQAGPAGATTVRYVQHRPQEDGDFNGKAAYLRAIAGARESILIESAYFVPPPEIKAALIAAARRGVRVEVLTNGRSLNDMPIVTDAARYHYDDLMAAGIKIHEKTGNMDHAKAAVFDGELSIVGSLNLNGRSDGRDTEGVAIVSDAKVGAENQRRFASGVAAASEVTKADLDGESMWDNLRQWTLQPFVGNI